jgi:NADH pyrophosphatase NudC (nudix superfamily)
MRWRNHSHMAIDPHIATLMVSTAVAGLLMALAGIGKNGLEWRQRRRICPSCGRELHGNACVCRG